MTVSKLISGTENAFLNTGVWMRSLQYKAQQRLVGFSRYRSPHFRFSKAQPARWIPGSPLRDAPE
jgi:hypothetical protein